VLSLPSDTTAATAAANSLLGQNADGPGNHELNDAYDAGEITVTVQYSETLNPFTPGALNGPYVRVIAQNFNIRTTLSKILGIDEMPVAASAVAGPSPTINHACDVAPLVVCADDPDEPYFGFKEDELRVLKNRPGDHEDVGPGNFKLLRLDCDSGGGGACVRENMAGGLNQCVNNDQTVETEPGVTQGPTKQGFNTRFGIYEGGGVNAEDYPPDVVVTAPSPTLQSGAKNSPDEDKIFQDTDEVLIGGDIDYSYSNYINHAQNGPHQYPPPQGSYGRRVMAMPVADCSGDDNGQSTLEVEGFACYFMLQPIEGAGETGMEIFGQFVTDCVGTGTPGSDPDGSEGPYIIQLYKDPDSSDS
jgi:hypothetical protein